jgi:hypothetical protein
MECRLPWLLKSCSVVGMERIVDVAKTGRMETHGCPVSAAETERVEALGCLVLCRIDGEGGDTWLPQSEREPL